MQAIVASSKKLGAPGCTIDVPLGHQDNVCSFDNIDTSIMMDLNAQHPDEIVALVPFARDGRPRARKAS